MGADYEGQEQAIEELRVLSEEAKGYLKHHLRNSLSVILGNAYLIRKSLLHMRKPPFLDDSTFENLDNIEDSINHIIEDLEKIGC